MLQTFASLLKGVKMIGREMIKNEWFKFARLYIFSNKVYLSLGFRHTVESGHE